MGGIALVFAYAGIEYCLARGWNYSPTQRAFWLSRTAKLLLRVLGFRLKVDGQAPVGSFLAPNHLGYMDIVVLGSIAPQVFLSKVDVAGWPVIGLYTRMAGTLYIDRARRSDVANRDEEFRNVMQAGLCLTVFLEGTSTDGQRVLPFRSSLLEPVTRNGWPITPVHLQYACEGGNAERDVCWWGDMTFGPHLLRMAKVKRIHATIAFGETRSPGLDRKELARELQASVLALRAGRTERVAAL